MSQPIVIEISTEEMFRNYLSGVIDIAWELRKEDAFDKTACPEFLQALLNGNMARIRKQFGCGDTFLLLNSKQMGIVEHLHGKGDGTGTGVKLDNVHIRVTHEGNVIGELVDCEISY